MDLFLAHWPVAGTPISVVLEALAEIQFTDRARLVGVSNYTVNQLQEALETFGADLLTNQVEYHPFLDQRRLLDFARREGMTLTAYCPPAKGKAVRDPTLRRIAAKHGKTATRVTSSMVDRPGRRHRHSPINRPRARRREFSRFRLHPRRPRSVRRSRA